MSMYAGITGGKLLLYVLPSMFRNCGYKLGCGNLSQFPCVTLYILMGSVKQRSVKRVLSMDERVTYHPVKLANALIKQP